MYCVRATLPSHNTCLYGKISNFKDFLKISRTFTFPDLWGLPSWYLGLSVKKKFRYLAKSLQVHVTTLYINEYLPFFFYTCLQVD